ncbi:hypothetical protein KW830_05650 [Comamonas sp. CMM03]|uniref:hypothetical protein n=1 Tax=Comamonas sp. CMM03 TaxID=2854781 RepID=UPI001C46C591|nr:hypothetical protein [Comamonas sp. CMM03]MBV7417937.1 hypothetical protein [Comamonas sp. CMM03]
MKKILLTIAMTISMLHQASNAAMSNFIDRNEHVVNLSPYVEITNFRFGNVQRDRTGSRMEMNADWKNIGAQPVVAFEIVVLKYDAFDSRMTGSRWVVTGKNSADWSPLEPGASSSDGTISFRDEETFTAIAYVRQVRLKDGTVWKVSDIELSKELKKVAPKIPDFGSFKPDPKAGSGKD